MIERVGPEGQPSVESPTTTQVEGSGHSAPQSPARSSYLASIQRKAAGDLPSAQLKESDGAGSALPAQTQQKMERSFGADFSDVRVHQGAQATEMGAHAYAQGANLHFAPGQYNPGSQSGDALIGHELTHVVQQKSGKVSSPQGKGASVVADHGLESQADRAGDRAARGEPVGESIGSGGAAGGAIQRQEAPGKPPVAEGGTDTFGLGGYLNKLKQSTGVSGDVGKFAEAKLGITTPPIPQLGGGALKIEGEGRYMTSKEGNELEIGLHIGVTWNVDLHYFKAAVEVFGEGQIKLKAKDGEMLETLGAAVKGVLYDALKGINVRNVAGLANPAGKYGNYVAEWALGKAFFDYDILKALNYLAAPHRLVPATVTQGAQSTLNALKIFFGSHKGSYEVTMAIGVGAEVGGGAGGKELAGGVTAKATHGISSEEGEEVSGEKRRDEYSIEAYLKKDETEGKVGFTAGGGRTVLSFEGGFAAENSFDFDKAKIVSVGGILKLLAAAGVGTSAGKAVTAPNGASLVNAVVSGLASAAGVIGNEKLKVLKKTYKLSLEIEKEGEHPWKDAKVDCKLFLGNSVGGDMDAGKLGKVEASAGAGTFISISRDIKDKLGGA